MSQASPVPTTPSDPRKSAKTLSEKRRRPNSAPRQTRKNRHSSPMCKGKSADPDMAGLYEELLVQKMEISYLKDQNQRLKEKSHLETVSEKPESQYFGSSLHSSHLIASLKHTIQQLKAELRLKDDETVRLKRNLKVSRVNELETELQAYIDECMRLRHHIEEVLLKTQSQEDIGHLEEIIRKLAADKADLEGQVERGKLPLQAQLKAALLQKEEQQLRVHALEAELSAAKGEVAVLRDKLRTLPSAPAPGPDLEDSKTSLPALSPQLQQVFKVLSYRLQLHRVAKSQLGAVLFGKKYSEDATVTFADLFSALSGPPCSVAGIEECRSVAGFLMRRGETVVMRDVVARLSAALPDWDVLSTDEENEFDQHISQLVTERTQEFVALCKLKDPDDTGDISMQALKAVCAQLHLDFHEREFHYLELLFFSLNFQLDQVPYKKFVQAYASDDNPETDEDDRQRLVQQYCRLIATQLSARKLQLSQVFVSHNGFLSPDRLIAGLKLLGIPALKKEELVLFLETLQSEELDEYGIEMQLFSDLVQECGDLPTDRSY